METPTLPAFAPLAERGPTSIGPSDGPRLDLGGLGVHHKIDGADTGQRFSVVHHPIAPRALAAPLHYHHREDEFSYVISGRLGALLGDDVLEAGPGTWVYKPRGQWHTFWNAGDEPCHLIEVISPAGFEAYFPEIAAAWGDVPRMMAVNETYDLSMRLESVPELCQRFGLTFPAM